MKYISEVRDGDLVSDIYLCKKKEILKTKSGKTYYSLLLQDKTGLLDGKIWEINNAIEHFENMDYIKVEGQVIVFQGGNQLNIRRLRRAEEGEYLISDYMPTTNKDIEQMYKELLEIIQKTKDIYLKQLLNKFFVEDEVFIKEFKNHSAAKRVHHGFIGGLLEHTLGVTKLCEFYASQYPILNRDLLITASIFHDIGKIHELSTFPENDYTDNGQLLGHIIIGTMMVDKKIKEIEKFPPKLARELMHCILSHHGELEFGSPKKPALIEALALTYADNTDAKIQTFTEILNSKENTGEWLGYDKLFETNIRHTSKPNLK